MKRRDAEAAAPQFKPVEIKLGTATGADPRPRTSPIPPEELPFTLLRVHGPGHVTISNSALDGFLVRYPQVGERTVRANPGTFAKAIAEADTLILDDGKYGPFTLDAGIKLIRAKNPGKVTFSGGTLRAFRSTLCLHGINLDGCAVRTEGGEIWASHFASTNAPGYAFSVQGGAIFLESGTIHTAEADGWNCNWANGRGTIVAAGIEIVDSGKGQAGPENRNAGSSHSGYVAAFGCVVRNSNGPEFADTAIPEAPNVSWYVGCDLDGAHQGFYFVGREAWLDTNNVRNPVPLEHGEGATVFTFQNSFRDTNLYDPEVPEEAVTDLRQRMVIEGEAEV